jgi:uncharacterized protein (TIGR00297 family)
MTARVVEGFLCAAAIALAARRAHSLTTSGAAAATVVGTLAVTAGWNWGALLIIYFVVSSAISRLGRATKEARTASTVAKTGERDAMQVLANGGVFAAAAAAMSWDPRIGWLALGAGALAASAADTWATEIGTLYGGEPRGLLGWRRVPRGTSGAVSRIGTIAALAGAAFIACVAVLLGWPRHLGLRIAVGGIAGALIDSFLGATIQGRRWCDACGRETERSMHDCGARTRPLRGLQWIDNDVVNLISGAAGALLTAVLPG